MTTFDDERIGELLRVLPPAPEGWVRAAQELPAARRSLDEIVARAEADLAFREALVADLEAALALEGYEPDRRVLDELGAFGGTGGFIAVDHRGEIALPFNTPGMYRGIAREGHIAVAIFGDETFSV